MTHNHSRLRELFIAACDLSRSDQQVFMDEHCSKDARLKLELIKLLEADSASGVFSDGSTQAGLEFQLDTVLEDNNHAPTVHGRYQFGNEIARGGMGAIIAGRDTELGRDLAIKVLLDEHKNNPLIVQRFLEEAQIGGQLQHPGIAPIYEVGQLADQRPFISMKLVKGETLATLLGQRDSPTNDLGKFLGIFEQICQTIAFAHSKSVIHRDLKPSNIMVGAFGEVQVMDWGLAKVLSDVQSGSDSLSKDSSEKISTAPPRKPADLGFESRTKVGSVMGTPAYMAVEQAQGRIDQLDKRTDVFALGAILCKILTGKEAYLGKNSDRILEMAANGELADCHRRLEASEADSELIQLAKACLASNQAERPTDAAALAESIEQYIKSVENRLRQAEIDRAKQTVQANEERKRRRVQLALGATLLAATILGSIGWVVFQKQKADGLAVVQSRINQSLNNARLHAGLAEATNDDADPTYEERVRELKLSLADANDAATLADSSNIGSSLRNTATSMVVDLEQRVVSARRMAQRISADIQLKQELETIRLTNGRKDDTQSYTSNQIVKSSYGNMFYLNDSRNVAKEYRHTFEKAGYTISQQNSEQLVERLKHSEIRGTLISALDNWARAIDKTEYRWNIRDKITSTQILEIANQIDSNQWRRKIRTAILNKQTESLKEFVQDETVYKQPVEMICWLGATLRNTGSNEASVSLLRKTLAEHPGDFWLNYELATSLAEDGKEAEALGYMRTVVSLRPDSPATLTELCRTLAKMNRLEEAMEVYERAIKIAPKFTNAYFSMARALSIANRTEEAIELYEKTIQIDGEFGLAYTGIGKCLTMQGKWDEAIEAYEKGRELEPNHSPHLFNIAFCLENKNLVEQAIAKYEEALELDPKFVPTLINLGNLFLSRREFEKALDLHEAALAIQPNNADTLRATGWTYAVQGKLKQAEQTLRKSILIDPKSADSRVNLGNVLGMLGQSQPAIKEFQKAIEIDPKHVKAHVQLGYILSTLGKTDQAIDSYDRALEIAPNDFIALDNKGIILLKQGNHEEAEKTLRHAIEVAPNNANAHFNLGFALNGLRKPDEAIVEYRIAAQLAPNHIPYLVNLGFAYNQQGDYSNAIASLKKALSIAPNDIIALKNLAQALEGNRQLADAVTVHRSIIKLKPTDAEQYRRLGTVFLKLEDLESAMTAFETAIELTPNSFEFHDSIARRLATSQSEVGKYFASQEGLSLAKQISESQPESAKFKTTLGIAQFRDKQWQAALDSLNELEQTNPQNSDFQIEALLYSAMANWHLENEDEAGEMYEAALRWKAEQAADPSPSQAKLFAETAALLDPTN